MLGTQPTADLSPMQAVESWVIGTFGTQNPTVGSVFDGAHLPTAVHSLFDVQNDAIEFLAWQ